ncbi:MAG: flagellar protein export ATPase FliI [Chromatiales bacterium]|nr:flagellar protein export ATPase FliI [Gammaproteobacteria bacterium]MCP5352480.1 flagellar protein export ATPase FliI [Chromatiales bacterium]
MNHDPNNPASGGADAPERLSHEYPARGPGGNDAGAGRWSERLRARRQAAPPVAEPVVEGKLTRVVGLTMEAQGCSTSLGGRVEVETETGGRVQAEVVGFSGERLLLMPVDPLTGVLPAARVIPRKTSASIPVGDALLGRVLDGTGKPLDGLGPLRASATAPLNPPAINPLKRAPIKEKLDTGVRAINAMLTVGKGQRMGLFAPAGVGKSTLLGMMTKHTNADVVVVGLIGERGREVQEFINDILGPEGLKRSVVVAAPADTPPLMRVHAAHSACAVAEYFRDQGRQVLLLMDSLTRYAQALREIGLAIGEPPAMRGFSPSVFARIPQLVERAGTGDKGGSITAFYTVLTDADAEQDPVAESARAILDGHIVLSRRLAEKGQFPAIDVEASISRLMTAIVTPEHQEIARRFRRLLATYHQNQDLMDVGAYVPGSNPEIDAAIKMYPKLLEYLRQRTDDRVSLDDSIAQLAKLVAKD